MVTLYYWHNLSEGVEADIQAAYTHEAQSVVDEMSSRIHSYQNFLSGSAGLFAIHGNLTQAEWIEYHQPYDIPKNYADVEAIGVNRYVSAGQLPAYVQHREAQGDTSFTITPAGDRSVYAPITFEAQYSGDKGGDQGYDSYTNPVLRTAMDQAVQANALVMSGKTQLVGQSDPSRNTFVIYLPVYQNGQSLKTTAERQSALIGFVYVAIDSKSFIDAALKGSQNSHFALQMNDAEAGTSPVLYQTDNFASIHMRSDARVQTNAVELYGHHWNFTFATTPDILPDRERQLPAQALWRGLITCVFFAGIVWYLITDRERKYARQKREEVQTAKDDLLSLASHQLRTPATVVKQYVGMLLQGYAGDLTDRQIDMLHNAYDNNERQLEIINQLLYVARLDAGRITLHREEVDIAKLVREVARDQHEIMTHRRQRLKFSLPKRPLEAEIDPHYMRMVVENLLSNAIKYTPEGGAVTLGVRRHEDRFMIRIKDTGVGIEPEAQVHVFEKFTRVENELSNDVNGSGVGLYLTKQIVELHGGTIMVDSTVGHGSTFSVEIPIVQLRSGVHTV